MNAASQFERAFTDETKRLLRLVGRLADDAYLVGGSLRDMLLDRPVTDFDIVTRDGIAAARAFASVVGLPAVRTYDNFGTATARLSNGLRLDFVTARRERYPSPAALPVVEPGSLDDDLRRRDFSVNALAMSLRRDDFGDVRDAVDGLADLKNGIIRALHPLSFVDDPTRVFRAWRFAERFGFALDEQTGEWMRRSIHGERLARLSGSRVRHELAAALRETRRIQVFRRFREENALDSLAEPCPMDDAALDAWGLLSDSLPFDEPDTTTFLLSWLGRWPSAKASKVVGWLELGAETTRNARCVLERRDDVFRAASNSTTPRRVWHRLLADLPENAVHALAALAGYSAFALICRRYEDVRGVRRLLTGDDVLAMGVAPGPEVRRILDAAFDAQLDGELLTRQDALQFADGLRRRDRF